MILNKTLILFVIGLLFCNLTKAQELKVLKSPDKNKVDINTSDGIATIFFDSSVKKLSITSKEGLDIIKSNNKLWFTYIDAKTEIENKNCCYTEFLLNSPTTNEYLLRVDDIIPGQVLYYTVVLPNQFCTNLSAEYIFTKTSKYGIRISFGNRFGGYVSYKWGKYYKAGTDISSVGEDYDITKAEGIGCIRTAITGGVRIGLVSNYNVVTPYEVYLLAGGGYGEYGRQWRNVSEVNRNIYFYSDYTKGVDAELAVQAILYNRLCLSAGLDLITGNGNITFDYQIGLGVNVPLSKVLTKKHK